MRKLRIFNLVMKRTKAYNVLLGLVLFVLSAALIIMLVEPEINTYFESLWYCYAVISTIGFGDVVVTSVIAKVVSVLLTVYSLFVLAIATGVVVSFYNHLVLAQRDDSISLFVDKLDRLPDLSKEELKEISDRIKKLR